MANKGSKTKSVSKQRKQIRNLLGKIIDCVSLSWQIEFCGKIIMPRHVRLCFARKTRFFLGHSEQQANWPKSAQTKYF